MAKFIPRGPKRYRHQQVGLRKLISTGGIGALLMDPGLGKTSVTLDYLSLLALKYPDREIRVLVAAPLAAIDTWVEQAMDYVHDDVAVWAECLGGSLLQRAEALSSRGGAPRINTPKRGPRDSWQGPRAAHWNKSWMIRTRSPEGRSEPIERFEGPDALGTTGPRLVLCVTNLDTFASRAQVTRSRTMADVMSDAVRRFNPEVVVVDEMHRIKGGSSNTSRLLSRIGRMVPRRIGLTGTVMPTGPADVWAQWRFLDPYAFGEPDDDGVIREATLGRFKERFIKYGGFMGREITGYINLDQMQEVMSRTAIVARKEEALDLPPVTQVRVTVNLTDREKAAYADMAALYAADLLDVDGNKVENVADSSLTQWIRLRQITSGYLPDSATGKIHDIGSSKANTAASLVHDNLAGEKRIVIFAVFTHEIELLRKKITRKGTEVMVVTGATSKDERLRMRKRFGVDPDVDPTRMVMIAQIQTMSLAVNELVSASHAVFASLTLKRDELVQAIDRLNRIGQTRPMFMHFLIAPGTIDEVIKKSHDEGTDLESSMLNHVAAITARGSI